MKDYFEYIFNLTNVSFSKFEHKKIKLIIKKSIRKK